MENLFNELGKYFDPNIQAGGKSIKRNTPYNHGPNMQAHKTLLSTGHVIEFNIGDIVYLKTDPEQLERIVTGIALRPSQSVVYAVALNTSEEWHYGVEISTAKDVVKSITN